MRIEAVHVYYVNHPWEQSHANSLPTPVTVNARTNNNVELTSYTDASRSTSARIDELPTPSWADAAHPLEVGASSDHASSPHAHRTGQTTH